MLQQLNGFFIVRYFVNVAMKNCKYQVYAHISHNTGDILYIKHSVNQEQMAVANILLPVCIS